MHNILEPAPFVVAQMQVVPEKWVYQAALAPFLAFYAFFAAVLYPISGQLHPQHLLEGIKAALPDGKLHMCWQDGVQGHVMGEG